ncbi:hypothetical protein SK128_019308, partial [Halocaridina rubra]
MDGGRHSQRQKVASKWRRQMVPLGEIAHREILTCTKSGSRYKGNLDLNTTTRLAYASVK